MLRCAALLLCGALAAPGFGQQANREQEQLRRLRLQVQKLQQDQTVQQDALQRATAEKTTAAEQATALRGRIGAAQAQLRRERTATALQTQATQALQKELDAAKAERTALALRLEQTQTELQGNVRTVQTLRTEGTDQQRRLATRETSFTELTARHQTQALGLQTCINNNLALRDIGLELLQRFANKGVADALAQQEPFLQFKRVAMENLLQDYQDKLDQQAVKAGAAVRRGSATPEPARAP